MLIRFSIKNWMSFKDEACFSMVASPERQHKERVPNLHKYKMKILPIAAIYGGNASGKTNFFKALNFVKRLVVKGTQIDSLIACEPFQLDGSSTERPSYFCFEFLIEDDIYEYSFSVTKKTIIEEKLIQIRSTSEKILYHRHDGKPHFHTTLQKNKRLEIVFEGTRDNQLFLNNAISQKVDDFRPVYNWFNDTLNLIAPDTRFGLFEQFLDEESSLYTKMNEMLRQLDTGIMRLAGEEISFENSLLPKSLKAKLQEEVKEGMPIHLLNESMNERFVITRKNGELIAKKLFTYHPKADGTEAKFEMRQESDGSQRIIDLLPGFLDIAEPGSKKVYIIDELDRSLHTNLTRSLIERYLSSCSVNSRSQLLMTTHDVLLMDQQLLRRDEMWVSERDNSGISKLFSFSEFKDVRYDKDIRKSYLQGRLGGVPKILLDYSFMTHTY